MPEALEEKPQRPLKQRIEQYRLEIQQLVKQGGEQPNYEFKRELPLNNPAEKIRLIKLIQAIANNFDIAGERSIIIGADPRERKFYPVGNETDFDPANLRKILASCLEPVPFFEHFSVTTNDNERFIIIVVSADQPRPIVVTRQMEAAIEREDGQNKRQKVVRLEIGDIWIKKNTHTERASRTDLDAMYNPRIEEESENRARKRLKHLQELGTFFGNAPAVSKPSANFAILVGPKADLCQFANELVASENIRPLRILLEIARDTFVHGWDKIGARLTTSLNDFEPFRIRLQDFYKNEFIPVLESLVELGLIVVKNEMDIGWLSIIVDYLVEGFESARGLQGLISQQSENREHRIEWWRGALDIYIGLRTLAYYGVLRNRLWFLRATMPRLVEVFATNENRPEKIPVMFFPLRFNKEEFNKGRAECFWKERVETSWGGHFGGVNTFLKCSQQIEFLMEFNSYCGLVVDDAKLAKWKTQWLDPNLSFSYFPDLYRHDLQFTAPMAERLYGILEAGEQFPPYLAVNPVLMDVLFREKEAGQRLAIYGDFLLQLLKWQQQVRFQANRYVGWYWSWDGRLGKLVEEARAREDLRRLQQRSAL